jgi:hypothetical protein
MPTTGGQGSTAPQAATKPTSTSGVQFTSSVYGQVIPVIYGCTPIAGRLVWAGNFRANGGGKGTNNSANVDVTRRR